MYLWCFATGVPQPTIIWYHNNKQLQSNSYLTITSPSVQQSAVIIQLTKYERDKGTYTCEARNNVTNLINAKHAVPQYNCEYSRYLYNIIVTKQFTFNFYFY